MLVDHAHGGRRQTTLLADRYIAAAAGSVMDGRVGVYADMEGYWQAKLVIKTI